MTIQPYYPEAIMLAKRIQKSLITSILLILLMACSSAPISMPAGLADLASEKINSSLRLTAPSNINTFKEDGQVALKLENVSETPILFTNNLGVKGYLYKDGTWIEINDKNTYYGEDIFVYPMSQSPSNFEIVLYHPDLNNYELPITLRIVVKGQGYQDGQPTDEYVGAYIDIKLDK